MKFLIVDDSTTMRRIIKNSLKQIGFENTIEAENGQEALKIFMDADIILTDWDMPEMNGLEFVRRVRTQDKNKPILMVTTKAANDDIAEALNNGVNEYIVKPYTPKMFREKIASLLEG